MDLFISDGLDVYLKVTSQGNTHYVCGTTLFSKTDVLKNYHPMDELEGTLHLHVIEFLNY
mgnify:CR=1 FL=1